MKNYFLRLFDYDRYANDLIVEAINSADQPKKAIQLMAHLLAAQLVWVTRCLDMPPANVELWPALGDTRFNFPDIIAANHHAWINYLTQLHETDFDRVINYKNMKGERCDNRLSDIIAHVINHSTHHRAQIGQQLKSTGFENLPVTDYIFYLRTLKN